MSQADELLDSLVEDEIAVYSANSPTEPHIVVNPDKTVTVPEELKRIIVTGEHNIETVTFDCLRYWDEHDLASMEMRIVYRRPDGVMSKSTVKNLVIDDTDSAVIHFDWVISNNVTPAAGTIAFMICAKNVEDSTTQNEWHTIPNKDITVVEGLPCDNNPTAEELLVAAEAELDNIAALVDEINGEVI